MTETMTYTSLDQLPVAVQAEDIAAVLGISRAGAYTLMRSKGFPTIYVGKRRMIVMRDKFIAWLDEFGAQNNINFITTISADETTATDGVKKFF